MSSLGVSIGLSDIVNVIMEEHKTYDLSEFMSDTGGAAGLFLGLNIIGNYQICNFANFTSNMLHFRIIF